MPDEQEQEEELEALPSGIRLRVLALIAAAFCIVMVLSWLLSGGGTELISRKIHLHTFIGDSGGLAKDADVRLNGVAIGKVTAVGLAGASDPTRSVRVDMKVQQKFQNRIPVDSIAAATATNLLGDEYLNIVAGKSSESVVDGAEIASLVQTGNFNPADLVSSLQTTIQRVDLILNQIQQGDTPVAQFVRGTDFYDSVSQQIASVHEMIRVYADPKSPTGQMLYNDELYNRIRQPILNIDHALEELQRGETPAGKLLTDSSAYDHAVAQIRTVHSSIAGVNSGESGMSPLLKSDDQYRQLQAQIQSLDRTVESLTHGEGAFAQLLQSSQLYDSLNGQTAAARGFLKEFRQNPRKFLRIKVF